MKKFDVMALTRDYKQTIIERAQREPAFNEALFNEAVALFRNSEFDTACQMFQTLKNEVRVFRRNITYKRSGLTACTVGQPLKLMPDCSANSSER